MSAATNSHPIHCSPLYGLTSCDRLALGDVLGLPLDRLVALAGNDKAYHAFIRTTSGKRRAVTRPLGDLLQLHDRMFIVLDQIEKSDYMHSGVKGRSHVTNARAHLGDQPMVKLDIRRFFPSIDGLRVRRFFGRQMACATSVADLLTRLYTYRGHVPIGSRMSQHLAYFAAKPMLEDLHSLSTRYGVVFTCYVDDLSFSGAAATPSFLWRVKQVVHHHRFRYHNDYCYRIGERKIVTGVAVAGSTLAVPPQHIDQMRQDERALDKLGGADQRKALERLIGRLAAAADIDQRHRKAMDSLVARRAQADTQPLVSRGNRDPGQRSVGKALDVGFALAAVVADVPPGDPDRVADAARLP